MTAVTTLPTHSLPVRVYYEDTDAGGIVYYANYLKFAERGRTELIRDLGIEHTKLKAERGIVFAVRHCTVDYRRSARLDDLLTVESRITAVGGASFDLAQDILRDGVLLVALHVKIASLDGGGRPARLPPAVRALFSEPAPISL